MSLSVIATLLRIAISLACLVLAFVGFSQAFPAHGPRTIGSDLDLAYLSVQLIFDHFPPELRNRPIPLALQIARFALPATAAWVTLSLAWEEMRNRGRSLLVRRQGEHLVVFGQSQLAEGLVKGERARRGRVMAWVDDADGRVAREAEALGAVHVAGPADTLDLRRLGLQSARTFVAAADSDAANLAAARRAIDFALEHRKAGDPLQVVARIDDVALQAALEARLTRRDQRDKVELRLASVPRLLARQFLLANPVDRVRPAPGQPLRLCWIGWSSLAETLLVRVLASTHFRGGRELELIVMDREASRAEQAFRSRRPEAFEIAPIRFVALDGDTPTLIAGQVATSAESAPLASVYVTSADASAALATALALETAFDRRRLFAPALYVHLPDAGGEAGLVDDSLIQPFGALTGLADPEALLQERTDGFARSIHAFYLEGRLNEGEVLGARPTLAEWKDLPEAVREDNRLVADCYLFKLRDVGAAVVEGDGPSVRFTPDEVESLAEAEHRRWMAAKRLDGWVHGDVRDDAERRHPDLVPYPELSEHIRELDREQVRMIAPILAASGRRALRDLDVELRSAEPTAPGAVRGALDTLRRDYPDRRIMVGGDPADEAARSVLLQAHALGYACSLAPSTPLPAVIEAAPAAERRGLAQLFRSADNVQHGRPPQAADVVVDLGASKTPAPVREAALAVPLR